MRPKNRIFEQKRGPHYCPFQAKEHTDTCSCNCEGCADEFVDTSLCTCEGCVRKRGRQCAACGWWELAGHPPHAPSCPSHDFAVLKMGAGGGGGFPRINPPSPFDYDTADHERRDAAIREELVAELLAAEVRRELAPLLESMRSEADIAFALFSIRVRPRAWERCEKRLDRFENFVRAMYVWPPDTETMGEREQAEDTARMLFAVRPL